MVGNMSSKAVGKMSRKVVGKVARKVVGTNEQPNHGPWPAALSWPAFHLSARTNTPNTLQYF